MELNINHYKKLFGFDLEWNFKTLSLFCFLIFFPNILGMLHYVTPFGMRIHFFQYLIFLAAILYGPAGGMISGAFGSIYTAFILNNPYIIIGNIILGGFFGLFVRYKYNVIVAVLFAYLIQLPWLWVTDIYLAHMSIEAVKMAVVALLFSDLFWAFAAGLSAKRIKPLLS